MQRKKIYDVIIIGSGAAGYNAALHLYDLGVKNIAIITEHIKAGTSRNTGSDKQTYYKLSVSGDSPDSPIKMAKTLFSGGAMDGDIAMCEAAHSLQEFFHLVNLGVEFPFNTYGEFVGYKTDHDPCQRGSSIGPYTSKRMTEVLEAEVKRKRIKIYDKTQVIDILVKNKTAYGVIAKTPSSGKVFLSENIIFATGGPAILFKNTVYPKSQFGASGILARSGVEFANFQEWQCGIGSIKFRWNLSGSYQQVLPTYVSIDSSGNRYNFLEGYFSDIKEMSDNIFKKGYQWPFDPRKLKKGSSLIDFAVYVERNINHRRVFLDFRRNPTFKKQKLILNKLSDETYSYLKNSDALAHLPVERLKKMNIKAYELYKRHKIDLEKELLEIDVLPQHNNGGANVNKWWETNIKHLFAIGECAGTHGVYRPGGSALNSGQVGGLRASYFIAKNYNYRGNKVLTKVKNNNFDFSKKVNNNIDIKARLSEMQNSNQKLLSCVRNINEIRKYFRKINKYDFVNSYDKTALQYNEVLILTKLLCKSVLTYYKSSGCLSRGSYILTDTYDIKTILKKVKTRRGSDSKKIIVRFNNNSVKSKEINVKPIPAIRELWFEKVWNGFNKIFNK